MKQQYHCTFCNQIFERYPSTVSNPNSVFCSRDHRCKWQKTSFKGENNPNFNNKWTLEKKEKQSKIVSKQMEDPVRRYQSGSANRGKKFSQEHIDKCHKNRLRKSFPHNEETKKLIGEKSKAKFTPEYKEKQRKINESLGIWIPLEQKSDFEIYNNQSNWIQRMWDLIIDQTQLLKLKEFGIFNTKTNLNGVIRDHIYSRRNGFDQGVFPEILRHPANCQILHCKENASKRSSSWISIEDLFFKIKNYSGLWVEQELVLDKISQYEQGKRWTNEYRTNN
jgi:hypothetical protein